MEWKVQRTQILLDSPLRKLSEVPQQEEISITWLRSERRKDNKTQNDRSRTFSAAVFMDLCRKTAAE